MEENKIYEDETVETEVIEKEGFIKRVSNGMKRFSDRKKEFLDEHPVVKVVDKVTGIAVIGAVGYFIGSKVAKPNNQLSDVIDMVEENLEEIVEEVVE